MPARRTCPQWAGYARRCLPLGHSPDARDTPYRLQKPVFTAREGCTDWYLSSVKVTMHRRTPHIAISVVIFGRKLECVPIQQGSTTIVTGKEAACGLPTRPQSADVFYVRSTEAVSHLLDGGHDLPYIVQVSNLPIQLGHCVMHICLKHLAKQQFFWQADNALVGLSKSP